MPPPASSPNAIPPIGQGDAFPKRAPPGLRLTLTAAGIALEAVQRGPARPDGGPAAATDVLPWADVLDVRSWPWVGDEKEGVLLIARTTPPAGPPGALLVPASALPTPPAPFVEAVRSRLDDTTYRAAPATPAPRSPAGDELRTALLTRTPVPGALEVPISDSRSPWPFALPAVVGTVGVSIVVGLPEIWGAAAVAGVVGLAQLLDRARRRSRRGRRRGLVVAPTGIVLGLAGGPRVVSWSQVAEVRLAAAEGSAAPDLELLLVDGAPLRVPGSRLGYPVELVAAVAYAYRRRHPPVPPSTA